MSAAPTTYGNVALPAITDDALHGSRDGDSYWYEPDVVVLAVERDDFMRRVTIVRGDDELVVDVLDVDMPPLTPCCALCIRTAGAHVPATTVAPESVEAAGLTVEMGAPLCDDCAGWGSRMAAEEARGL